MRLSSWAVLLGGTALALKEVDEFREHQGDQHLSWGVQQPTRAWIAPDDDITKLGSHRQCRLTWRRHRSCHLLVLTANMGGVTQGMGLGPS